MKRTIKKSGSTEPPLSSHEWDFKDVNANELEACHLYEYAREFFKRSEHLQKCKKDWNDPAKRLSGEYYEAGEKAFDLLRTRCQNFPHIKFDYFPKTNWQDLPDFPTRSLKAKRKKLRLSLAEDVNDWSKRFRKSRFDRLYITTLHRLEPFNAQPLGSLAYFAGMPPQSKLSEIYSLAASKFESWTYCQAQSESSEYGLFHINWNYSDSEIKRAFDEWLQDELEERKKLGMSKIKPVSNRGGFRDRLNWLGALRVKNHYRKKDLVDYNDTNLKVGAPYSHYPDLLKNAKKAEQEIARMFPKDWSEDDYRRREDEFEQFRKENPTFMQPTMQ